MNEKKSRSKIADIINDIQPMMNGKCKPFPRNTEIATPIRPAMMMNSLFDHRDMWIGGIWFWFVFAAMYHLLQRKAITAPF